MEITIKHLEPGNISSVSHLLTTSQQGTLLQGGCLGLFATTEGAGVGVVLFCVNAATITVSSVQVAISHRRRGVGSILISALRKLAKQQTKQLVCPFAATGQGTDAYVFFARQPGVSLVQQPEFSATISRQRIQNSLTNLPKQSTTDVVPLLSQSNVFLQNLAQSLEVNFPQIAHTLRFAPESFDSTLSFCTVHATGITSTCIMESNGDFATLVLLYSKQPLGTLVFKSLVATMEAFMQNPNLQRLNMVITTDVSGKILEKLCPDYITTHRIYHAYF
ncbi:MAG: GNAT family N-acetyltransferase [Eubacteriales bacterium]